MRTRAAGHPDANPSRPRPVSLPSFIRLAGVLLLPAAWLASGLVAPAPVATAQGDELVAAGVYCAQSGGAVRARYPAYGTNDPDPLRLAGVRPFCEFTAEDGSRIVVALDTLYATAPTLAALAGGESCLLRATAARHPRYGGGLGLRLTLPVYADPAAAEALPLVLNALERAAPGGAGGAPFLGSWGTAPDARRPFVEFAGFLPNAAYRPGLLPALAGWWGARAPWARRALRDPALRARTAWRSAARPAPDRDRAAAQARRTEALRRLAPLVWNGRPGPPGPVAESPPRGVAVATAPAFGVDPAGPAGPPNWGRPVDRRDGPERGAHRGAAAPVGAG
jgi:hypothetical protein